MAPAGVKMREGLVTPGVVVVGEFPANYAKLVKPRLEPEVVGTLTEWLLKRMR